MTERYDAIVMTGQGDLRSPSGSRGPARKTAIIERKRIGGTCVNNGCIPTKTLIASARAAHVARRGGDFGVAINGAIKVDMARVKARKDAVVRHSTDGLTHWLITTPGVSLIHGHARFESARTVRVGDDLLEAEQIFVNVGAAQACRNAGIAVVPIFRQQHDNGGRLPARASGDRRRQLRRAGIRADVSALRQSRDRDRDGERG
jgi:pyruvate/2-oxoglutarate dehydrogenase complex dihydrolipoamide dehydrogenase (E3) component